RAVQAEGAYTNLALQQVLRRHGLDGRDAAFATELVSGTVRRQGTYDAVLAACVDRPLTALDPPVLDALRLGTHQLLAMRVPAHAAVGTTVDLVRTQVHRGAAGFANAVLRKVGAHDLEGWIRRLAPDPEQDPHGFAEVAHAHPRWVVELLAEALAHHGRGADELDVLLAADNEPAKVTLVARPGLSTVAELVEGGAEATGSSPYAATMPGGDPGAVPAVAEGRAGVQDEGSQIVTLALADAPVEGEDTRWLDMCAGPGGKAALLGALARERGATVLANELQEHRSALVRSAVARLDDVVDVVTGDGTAPTWQPGSFDRVLLDAPCTGLGALRRRPEARWRRTPADLETLTALQSRLLEVAVDSVRPGGVVGYVTCSPVVAETSDVVSALLARAHDVELLEVRQLWPHVHGTDAMFLALLRRT
ncbi:RsmB/NOP family class I SAM-dependent RNA methyltransferase, partial [Nocardioides sp.]|uniref:RsmB/NOP family class I SAM-dependent RNA methyltransferase n=1 Tax=Nocardioides sp. TaxID=35761 RepID=UPI0027331A38